MAEHITRSSDSSVFDEICVKCGLTDQEGPITGECSVPGTRGSDHVVRSWPHLFQAMLDGVKTHDLRKDDRGYKAGDVILHREYDIAVGGYTGREQQVEVTYITGRNEGQSPCAVSSVVLDPEYVILSIRKLEQ